MSRCTWEMIIFVPSRSSLWLFLYICLRRGLKLLGYWHTLACIRFRILLLRLPYYWIGFSHHSGFSDSESHLRWHRKWKNIADPSRRVAAVIALNLLLLYNPAHGSMSLMISPLKCQWLRIGKWKNLMISRDHWTQAGLLYIWHRKVCSMRERRGIFVPWSLHFPSPALRLSTRN